MSLYDLIPLPPELVQHIADVGNFADTPCDKCKTWMPIQKCTACQQGTCCCDGGNCYAQCCTYCHQCWVNRICNNAYDVKAVCEKWIQECNYDTCPVQDQCKPCCRTKCKNCKEKYCCKHCTYFFVGPRQVYMCIRCWDNISREMNDYFK